MSDAEMQQRMTRLERSHKRAWIVFGFVTTALVAALIGVAVRAWRPVDTVNRAALRAMLIAQYEVENPPPRGVDEDVLVRAYDAKWMEYRRNVLRLFEVYLDSESRR